MKYSHSCNVQHFHSVCTTALADVNVEMTLHHANMILHLQMSNSCRGAVHCQRSLIVVARDLVERYEPNTL